MKIDPGTYENLSTDNPCWTKFTLYANGQVIFTDASDGHAVYWSVNHADGPSWLEWSAKQLTSGQLRKVR